MVSRRRFVKKCPAVPDFCGAGLYEQQDEDQPDCNLRGKFYTDDDGNYGFYCLRPTPYPVSIRTHHVSDATLKIFAGTWRRAGRQAPRSP